MFNGIRKIFNAIKKSLVNDSSFSSLTGGMGASSLSGGANDATLMASNKNWVFVCVNAIAKTISGIELELRKYNTKGDDEEVVDSPVLLLLYKPNRFQTGRDFFYCVASQLELVGNAYILKNQEKNPTELLLLNQ